MPLESPERERRAIVEYWELESGPDAKVLHAEKVASEKVMGQRHDVWDVHGGDGRWWVITSPTNLYSQEAFESMDFALSFHIGLTTRVAARSQPPAGEEEQDRLSTAWRRWTQAGDALSDADEAEEFQAVGMRCRECLLALVKDVADPSMVPEGEEAPQRANFIGWSELVAAHLAAGPSGARLRAYMRDVAKRAWEFVQWLTHAENAVRFDGEIAVEATGHVLMTFGMALVRMERGAPDRCPRCSSYRLTSVYRPEIRAQNPYVTLCEACEWEDIPTNDEAARA